MDGTYHNIHAEVRNTYKSIVGKHQDKIPLGNVGVLRSIIVKLGEIVCECAEWIQLAKIGYNGLLL